MPLTRLFRARTPAAFLAVACFGVSALSCRPAVDPTPLGPAIRLVMHTQPAGVRVGVPASTPAVIDVVDRNNALITTPGLTVRASVVAGSAQIVTGAETSVVNGEASFSTLTLTGVANASIQLTFVLVNQGVVSAGVTANAATLTLNAGLPATVRATSTAAIAGSPGTIVTPAPAVLVTDLAQNVLAGIPVTFDPSGGEGRINGAAQSTTDATGVATVAGWVLGLPGNNQLVATVSPTLQVTFNAVVTTTVGMLRIRLTGEPSGSTAHVHVVKTSVNGVTYDAFSDVRDSLTVTGLPFGTYQVTGDSVNVGSRIWMADASITGLNVGATSGPSIALAYREYGRISVTTRGLPQPTLTATINFLPTAGATAAAFSLVTLNDAVTRGLGPIGTYNAVPAGVTVTGQQYTATPAQQSVPVLGGDDVAQMTFTYTVITGTLTVTLDSLPAGAAPQVDITGPGGFHQTVFMSGTRSFTGLVPGSYTIVASPIVVAGVTLKPAPVTSPANVTAGVETTVKITYGQ